jgi:hypothetical protein
VSKFIDAISRPFASYGLSPQFSSAGADIEAISKAEALTLRVLADRLEHVEKIPELKEMLAVSA